MREHKIMNSFICKYWVWEKVHDDFLVKLKCFS